MPGKIRQSLQEIVFGKVLTGKQETLLTDREWAHSEQPQNEQKEKLRITLPLGLSAQYLLTAQ